MTIFEWGKKYYLVQSIHGHIYYPGSNLVQFIPIHPLWRNLNGLNALDTYKTRCKPYVRLTVIVDIWGFLKWAPLVIIKVPRGDFWGPIGSFRFEEPPNIPKLYGKVPGQDWRYPQHSLFQPQMFRLQGAAVL
jgi:hypothetical protein